MERKGFPESYDVRRLLRFVADVKSGRAEVDAPVYSHLRYDIVPDERIVVRQPDIMIVEGLNVAAVRRRRRAPPRRCRACSCPTSSTSRSTWTRTSRTSCSGT